MAAGCEKCGADLEAYARRARLGLGQPAQPRRRVPRIDLPSPLLTRLEAVYLVATVACLVWISFLAIILGVLGALHGYYEHRPGWIALCVALATVGLGLELSRL